MKRTIAAVLILIMVCGSACAMTDAEARATLFEYGISKLNLPEPSRSDLDGMIGYPSWLSSNIIVGLTDDGEYVKSIFVQTYSAQNADFLIAVALATYYFAGESVNPFPDYYYLRVSGEQERWGALELSGLQWTYIIGCKDGGMDFTILCEDR
jgi:hypothetical protein